MIRTQFTLLFSTLAIATTSYAGDGGFDLRSCQSESGRTSLTVYQDNFSDADVPARVIFVIDGQPVIYNHYRYDLKRPEDQVCQDDCTAIQISSRRILVSHGDYINMDIEISGNKAIIKKGFADPRNDFAPSQTAVQLSCKSFHMAP